MTLPADDSETTELSLSHSPPPRCKSSHKFALPTQGEGQSPPRCAPLYTYRFRLKLSRQYPCARRAVGTTKRAKPGGASYWEERGEERKACLSRLRVKMPPWDSVEKNVRCSL